MQPHRDKWGLEHHAGRTRRKYSHLRRTYLRILPDCRAFLNAMSFWRPGCSHAVPMSRATRIGRYEVRLPFDLIPSRFVKVEEASGREHTKSA